MNKPPKAVRHYMEEFEEAEEDVRKYILRQLKYYAEIPDKATSTPEQWMGFTLGCSATAAATAIKWAKGQTISRVMLPNFETMPLAVLPKPFDHPEWIFECKYDGFRALAYSETGMVRLVSRKGNVYKSFPGLCAAMGNTISCRNAVLDGEIVHLDADGKPQFHSLAHRRSPQQFVAFDILGLNGRDLRPLPLIQRKRILRKLVPAGSPILFADFVDGSGTEFFRAVCEMDLEGIVAKRKDGLYRPEATTRVKIKNPTYSQGEGRRDLFQKRLAAA